jgi:predicted nuclease with TOPRIM domain
MTDTLENLQKMAADLNRQREELQSKLPAANEDVRDEWSKLETRWEEIGTKMDIVRHEISDRTETVSIALSLALNEVKNGYATMRERLSANP